MDEIGPPTTGENVIITKLYQIPIKGILKLHPVSDQGQVEKNLEMEEGFKLGGIKMPLKIVCLSRNVDFSCIEVFFILILAYWYE